MDVRIGVKIRALRKDNDVTQEKLAEYLSISYQAVSKWENGTALPEITLIPPIANFFGITIDELFGASGIENDARIEEYKARLGDCIKKNDGEGRYETAKAACAEFPRNYYFLSQLAQAEMSHPADDMDFKVTLEKSAIKHAQTILNDCTDDLIRSEAALTLCCLLPLHGRRGEAVALARRSPNNAELLKWCLVGEEYTEHLQTMVFNAMKTLIESLIQASLRPIDIVATRETGVPFTEDMVNPGLDTRGKVTRIIETVIDDGNYLDFHYMLSNNYIEFAGHYQKTNDPVKAAECSKKALFHAREWDKLEAGKEYRYTAARIGNMTYCKPETAVTGRQSREAAVMNEARALGLAE